MKKILTTFVSLLLIAAATIGSAKAQEPQTSQTTQTPKYTIKFASGTDDTAHWSFTPAEAHTTGVEAGTQVTLTYSGSLRVKSVTAEYEPTSVVTPLTFVAKTTDGATVTLNANGTFAPAVNLEYSTDGGSNWITYSVGTGITLTNVGDMVQFRALSNATHTTLGDLENYAYNHFTLTGDCYAYGNVMSLLYNDFDEETTFPEGSNSNFYYLFTNCSTLYNHPSVDLVLPATQLANYCYNSMFSGCTHLTTAPELPATTLANYCYSNMFQSCTTLTAAPALPATTLASSCYNSMFRGCTSLTTAPELPATTLVSNCYNSMFYGCSDLTSAPALPATTLASNCYRQMFRGCASLQTAPVLPATTLVYGCYYNMFNGCSSLNYIKCMATDGFSASYCLNNWVSGVAEEGNFYCYSANDWETGTSGIPEGWTVHAALSTPLTFAAKEAGATVTLTASSSSAPAVNLQYSTDGGSNWSTYSVGTTVTLTNIGDKVQFRASSNNTAFSVYTNDDDQYNHFVLTGDCYAYGNVMSLLYTAAEFPTAISFAENSTENFVRLFENCSTLYNHPSVDLVLPATTLADYCYYGMFYGCTALTSAPELPATTLANCCYLGMFYGCSSLTTAPVLPATTLATNCYSSMFQNCTSLTTAPELPATTLAYGCYSSMFSGCTGLTTAPELPATTLAEGCYYGMFSGCTSLNSITCKATDGFSAIYCLTDWVSGVATTGDFYCYLNDTLTATVPNGWTTHDLTPLTPLTFVAKTAGATVAMTASSSSAPAVNLQYSTDGGSNWSTYSVGTTVTLTNVGDAVQFRAKSDNATLGDRSNFAFNYFTLTDDCYAYGNVMSLLYNDFDEETTFPEGSNCNFYYLFTNCSTLYNHPSVDLVLPATQLANYCYNSMFSGCTHLTTAPELPATTLVSYCYRQMFNGCASLTSAPELPATTLTEGCYRQMFQNCTSLNSITCMATDGLSASCLNDWVSGVATSGTFVRHTSATSWPTGTSGIPSGWTVNTANN